MTKRTTIILFYCGVAAICAAILALVNLVLVPGLKAKGELTESFVNVGVDEAEQWFPIAKDLVATNQAGESVKLSDLRGKVFVIAEFFAVCPHCAVRNGTELRAIYDQFKADPNFHMVCISVDPKTDNTEKLSDYAAALSADTKNWWFLNAGDEKATHDYLENTLKFFGIRERTDAEDIETNGKFKHDMGLIVVDKEFNVVGKWPLADARSEEGRKLNPGLYEKLKAEMLERIKVELQKDKP